jgi:tetratricopeptide (TPR) repeat protein
MAMRIIRLLPIIFLSGLISVAGFASPRRAADRPAHFHARRARAQDNGLGSVSFPISCAPAVQATFNTGVALLHSFQYQEAEQTFTQVAQQDPQCAMAYWGKAMSLYHQLWDWPSADTLKEGHEDTAQAQKLRAKTDSERMYIVAAGVFFQDNAKLSRASRTKAYSDWMGRVFTKYPDDVNAGAFYALSLITVQGKKADELANREQAIDILNKLFAIAPNHPGVAHYLIHATDTPELASQGLVAARRYAKIAPDSSHALHMPSHIFVRLGLWQEAIDSNIAATAAATKATQAGQADASYQFHAMDFLDYAYLQSGQAAKARGLVDELKNVAGASAEDVADNQANFAARNAFELHQWKEAAALPVPDVKGGWQATTYFARAIGAARTGDAAAAQENLAKYKEAIAGENDKVYGVSSSATIGQQEVEAWVDYAEGKNAEAVKAMRAAAAQEATEGVDSLSMPAREMLGDMLTEMKRPREALVEYKAALQESPNRFDSLYGAAQSAQLSGSAETARKYYAKLIEMCGNGADRLELEEARTKLAQK